MGPCCILLWDPTASKSHLSLVSPPQLKSLTPPTAVLVSLSEAYILKEVLLTNQRHKITEVVRLQNCLTGASATFGGQPAVLLGNGPTARCSAILKTAYRKPLELNHRRGPFGNQQIRPAASQSCAASRGHEARVRLSERNALARFNGHATAKAAGGVAQVRSR